MGVSSGLREIHFYLGTIVLTLPSKKSSSANFISLFHLISFVSFIKIKWVLNSRIEILSLSAHSSDYYQQELCVEWVKCCIMIDILMRRSHAFQTDVQLLLYLISLRQLSLYKNVLIVPSSWAGHRSSWADQLSVISCNEEITLKWLRVACNKQGLNLSLSNSRKQINVLIYVTVCLCTEAGTEGKTKQSKKNFSLKNHNYAPSVGWSNFWMW